MGNHNQLLFQMATGVVVLTGLGALVILIAWLYVLWRIVRATYRAVRRWRAGRRNRREGRHTAEARAAVGWTDQPTQLINFNAEETQLLARYDDELFGGSVLDQFFTDGGTR